MKKDTTLLHIWRFTDGKPGHQNQSLGLVQALQKQIKCDVREWIIPSTFLERWKWRRNWNVEVQGLAKPQLIIGAGHRTHTMLLRAQRQFGGKSVVLMKPSLPVSWFDLCVVPEHDRVRIRPNVLPIRGVLSTMDLSMQQDESKGLILIGGPCRHINWSNEQVIQQIVQIVKSEPNVHWSLSTSPRTPDTFLNLLKDRASFANLTQFSVLQTPPGWIAERLNESKQVWATGDSVSMLYESLSSGAATGVLNVSWTQEGKIWQGIQQLINEGMLTSFDHWGPGEKLTNPNEPLREAERVAQFIVLNWFK